MSLIVLNSKGSDPESFSNFMTENIEFPANAEVCLVGSHINRKLLIPKEIQFSAHGNRLAFQYGKGNLLARTVGNSYTPHAPYAYNFHDKAQMFPLKFKGYTEIEGAANAYLNDKRYTPISPLVGGWECDIPATDLFTIQNTQRVPDRVQSEGTEQSIFCVPGGNHLPYGGNNNVTHVPEQPDIAITPIVGAGYTNWTNVQALTSKVTQFIDVNPIFNTDNGKRLAVLTPLPSGVNIDGGGWHWQFSPGAGSVEKISGLRGGIVASGGEIINPDKGDEINGTNTVLNKLSGSTDFTVWWQVSKVDVAAGSATVDFYKRPVLPIGNKAYVKQMDGAILWTTCLVPASIAGQIRVGMRPINSPGTGYVIEGYAMPVTTATNVMGAIVIGAAQCKITDPLDFTEAPETKCNLYRHLPLYQGVTNISSMNIAMNTIHHGDHDGIMAAATQGAGLDYTFGFQPLSVLDQQVEKFDKDNFHNIYKANIGYALGYTSPYLRQTATLMIPAAGGVTAEIPVDSTVPLNHSLVVSLPDLPISGFFGNSTGTFEAGTLDINSGGTSAPIIGVIPFGEAPLRESNSTGFQNGDAGAAMASRGSFYAAPMENWIKLKNPAPFKLSSIACRLTDELGNKPNVCAGNTTITIKIKARDGGLTIQGN